MLSSSCCMCPEAACRGEETVTPEVIPYPPLAACMPAACAGEVDANGHHPQSVFCAQSMDRV